MGDKIDKFLNFLWGASCFIFVIVPYWLFKNGFYRPGKWLFNKVAFLYNRSIGKLVDCFKERKRKCKNLVSSCNNLFPISNGYENFNGLVTKLVIDDMVKKIGSSPESVGKSTSDLSINKPL
jgi:hypothetical protein